jgi:hypothetical protein
MIRLLPLFVLMVNGFSETEFELGVYSSEPLNALQEMEAQQWLEQTRDLLTSRGIHPKVPHVSQNRLQKRMLEEENEPLLEQKTPMSWWDRIKSWFQYRKVALPYDECPICYTHSEEEVIVKTSSVLYLSND